MEKNKFSTWDGPQGGMTAMEAAKDFKDHFDDFKPGPLFDKDMIKHPDPVYPMPPIAGPNSRTVEQFPPKWSVKNIYRMIGRDELAVWSAIAALRMQVDDTIPEDQLLVVNSGAAEAIIAAMKAYPNHANMQVCAAGTLVIIAKVDAASRKRVIEAGGLVEVAEAVRRCVLNPKGDGQKIGKYVVNKGDFCKECLVKIAGKRTDPRNRKHISAAIEAGVPKEWFDFKREEPKDDDDDKKPKSKGKK
mmetsp:Transcript_36353/g.60236  ORF Transcript_36353/g.60236 Transcript_36353/m.60236 type:complete len:246 (+) Transcript_36353:22-759(+)|eukprot:CAMPEP_0119303202 /NCGR_PEP_ID=MMETSP1333-20130426/4672_1 /TAXON_ID=418940 /ORGANISM="Scyphosphaera apsteinii, Strain RCC1455" /LENGTH=245 /DNA_ID=CAMNT_0007305809 /DNA_START=27 /DNA_END=764 /DNA_ORIENTATION=-